MDNNEVVTEEVAAVVENNTGIEIEPLFEEQVDFDTFSKSDFRVVKVKNCEAVPKSKKLLRFTLDDGTENERTILSGVHAFYEPVIYALSDFLIMILSWLVKQSLRAFLFQEVQP